MLIKVDRNEALQKLLGEFRRRTLKGNPENAAAFQGSDIYAGQEVIKKAVPELLLLPVRGHMHALARDNPQDPFLELFKNLFQQHVVLDLLLVAEKKYSHHLLAQVSV